MQQNNNSILIRYTYFLLASMLTIFALIQARDFLIPIAIGVLLSYLLFPVVNFFEKKGIPRIIAILTGIAILILFVVIIASLIYQRVSVLMDDFPSLRRQAISNMTQIQHKLEVAFGVKDGQLDNFLKNMVSQLFETGFYTFNTLFQATTTTLLKALLMPVYIFLFLYYRTKFANFIVKLMPPDRRFRTIRILRSISLIVTRYLVGVFFVVACLCILNPIGLIIIGVEYPIILGMISAVFSFIPYFGNIIGGSIPFLFTFFTSGDPILSVKVAILYFIIHFIENNILAPNIVGNNVRINPFFIILGLIGSASIWGIAGMLVFVPFLAIIKVILEHIPGYEPIAFLLDVKGTSRHAINLVNLKKRLKSFRF